jgi:hypothetical protein
VAFVKNLRTGKVANVPDHYIGHPVLGKDLELISETAETLEVSAAPKTKKKKAEYIPNPVDADGDGLVQDGTEWERPLGVSLPEEQPAPETENEDNEEK